MGEVLNLRLARKRRARAEREDSAERNRVLHGMPKAKREAAKGERERSLSRLDGHRLSDD